MISKGEHEMVGLYNKSGVEIGVITANQQETVFFFYERCGDKYKKLGKAANPLELERRFNVKERMSEI